MITHLLCVMIAFSASAQILPYFSPIQLNSSQLWNPYLNPLYAPATNFGIPSYGSLSPYQWLYSPFSVLNNLVSLNKTTLYPQASLAGSLIPFTPFYWNPFTVPYNAAGTYFASAVTDVDVAGTWSGVWISTFLAGGVTTGDLSLTLAQSGTNVTGTVAFFLNKILKFGADVVGSVEGNILTLTSTVIPGAGGTKSFDVTITATVNVASMDGTYLVINNVTGNIAEEGTFTATRL